MGVGSRSQQTDDVLEYRHPKFFTDPLVAHLYPDLKRREVELPSGETGEDGKEIMLRQQVGPPLDLEQYKNSKDPKDRKRDAYIRFKRIRTGDDSLAIPRRMWEQDILAKLIERQNKGENVSQDIQSQQRATTQEAEIEQLVLSVHGPYWQIQDTYKNRDYYGDDPSKWPEGLDPDAKHELAGKTVPVEVSWIKLWDEIVRDGLIEHMHQVHGGRSPEQEAMFPASPVSLNGTAGSADARGADRTQPA